MPVCLSLIAFFLRSLDGPCSDWDLQREKHGLSPIYRASQVALVVKNPPAIAGVIRDGGCIPRLGGSPEGGQGNPLQYSWLENPMDRGDWWATVHRVSKSWTWLKQLSVHTVYNQHCERCKSVGNKTRSPGIYGLDWGKTRCT